MQPFSLEQFNGEMSRFLAGRPGQERIFEEGQALVQQLIASPDFTRGVLERLAIDAEFAALFFPSIDPNDLTLYRDPAGEFSVRLFVWDASVPYPPHDHGSWGIVGALGGRTREVKWERLDRQNMPGYAELRAKSEAVLSPGQTTWVLPLDEGIHSMQAVGVPTSLTLHVYGRAVRKGFIQAYHPARNQVYRMYSPTLARRAVALHALGVIDAPWSKEVLRRALQDPRELIREEAELALSG
ncbi:MAG: cysteine dioxygenase family protein [Syntrophomonadaceae bacterium]|nr:cysteine dioxygenase family protein [Syntrophomonadaceae bacterium]